MITYILLLLTTMLAWQPKLRKIGAIMFCLFLLSGYLEAHLNFIAISAAALLTLAIAAYGHPHRFIKGAGAIIMLILTALLFTHQVPGFYNIKVWDDLRLTANSAPTTMYLNFDKPLFGILLLLIGGAEFLGTKPWRYCAKIWLMASLPLIAIGGLLGLYFAYLAIDPKWSEESLLWMVNNLLVVCVAEEVFFRGFIQGNLSQWFCNVRSGEYLAVGLAALIFGIAHYNGGLGLVAISTVAGLFYGLAFKTTKSLVTPICVHFTVNAVHFFFFTYPYYSPM